MAENVPALPSIQNAARATAFLHPAPASATQANFQAAPVKEILIPTDIPRPKNIVTMIFPVNTVSHFLTGLNGG
nr:MAG TPA: hypothetical protein [Caudoviricetes sp.]